MTEIITIEQEIAEKEQKLKEMEDKYGISVINNNSVISSRQVADIFGKRHDNVLKKIRELIKKNKKSDNPKISNALVFEEVKYVDAKGEKRPEFIMALRGFSLLTSSFRGDESYYYMVLYTGVFEEMGNTLIELNKLISKREQLLLEEEKHYLYSNDYKDYCIINNICGFSTNYLFEPVVNWNNPNKPKMVKTQAYSLWSKQFREKAHDKLINYVKENNIDLTKNIYITFVMKYPEKLDLVNLEKGLIDQITLILQDLEPSFDDVQVKALYMRTGGGGSAKEYNDSIIAIRIQN